jgi:hypothetical protein
MLLWSVQGERHHLDSSPVRAWFSGVRWRGVGGVFGWGAAVKAKELRERLAVLMDMNSRGAPIGFISESINLARDAIAALEAAELDSARLDWCEGGNNCKDMGHYYEVRTGSQVGNFRAAIDAAMKHSDAEAAHEANL